MTTTKRAPAKAAQPSTEDDTDTIEAPESAVGGFPEPGVVEDEPTLYPLHTAILRGLLRLSRLAAESHGHNAAAVQIGDEIEALIDKIE